jgi:hypothetical protein
MKRLNIWIAFFSLFVNSQAISQTWQWAIAEGGSGWDVANAISLDAKGYIYLTGKLEQQVVFANAITLNAQGQSDIFLAKYDSMGNLIWVKIAGGTGNDIAWSVAALPEGGCYITGSFTGNAVFGNDTLYGDMTEDIFLAKYDDDGNLLWAKQCGGLYDDVARGVAVMPDGGCVITGYFRQKAGFGAATEDSIVHNGAFSGGESDMFLARFDALGNLIWVKGAGAPAAYCESHAVCVDATGNIAITGSFAYAANFENTQLTAVPSIAGTGGSRDIFVAKYNAMGLLQWAKSAGGGGDPLLNFSPDVGRAITSSKDGYIWVSGSVCGHVQFDTIQLTAAGSSDGFIAKYNSSGTAIQAYLIGSTGEDVCNGIAINNETQINICGQFTDSIPGNSNSITATGATDGFVAVADMQGVLQHLFAVGNDAADQCNAVAVGRDAQLYVTGNFSGANLSMPPFALNASGGSDFFIGRLKPEGQTTGAGKVLSLDVPVQIYPNPFSEYFFIKGIKGNKIEISLFDLSGRSLYQVVCKEGDKIVPNVALQPGIYFYSITATNQLPVRGSIIKAY